MGSRWIEAGNDDGGENGGLRWRRWAWYCGGWETKR